MSPTTTTILIALLAVCGLQAHAQLAELCAGGPDVVITKTSQLSGIITQMLDVTSCPAKGTFDAIVAIDRLVVDKHSSNPNACSLEKILEFKSLYEKFIVDEMNEYEVPTAIKRYIVAYGFQLSRMCKKIMINSLLLDGETVLSQADFDMIDQWTNDKSPMGELLGKPDAHDDLILPGDLTSLRARAPQASPEPERVPVQSNKGETMKRLQAVCQRRFKPVYEQLILPVLYLSNLGFSIDKDAQLERELAELRTNPKIHRWYRTVYLCESLASLEVLEDLTGEFSSADPEGKTRIKILSIKEAERVRAEQPHNDYVAATTGLEQATYSLAEPARVDDEVLDRSDAALMDAVETFDVHMSKIERIRAKLLRKSIRVLQAKLNSGEFWFSSRVSARVGPRVASAIARGHYSLDVDANQRIAAALDSYVDDKQAGEPKQSFWRDFLPALVSNSWIIFGLSLILITFTLGVLG